MGPLPFSTRAPLLHLPPQNPLHHVSRKCRPLKICFGDFELYSHSDSFFLGVNRSHPKTSLTSIIDFKGPWDDFTVHGVNNPSVPLFCACDEWSDVRSDFQHPPSLCTHPFSYVSF